MSLIQQENQIILFCNCQMQQERLCRHQAQLLFHIIKKEELKIFFNPVFRHRKLKQFAHDYGLEKEEMLDFFFSTIYRDGQVYFKPKREGLIPVNRDILEYMNKEVAGESGLHQLPESKILPNIAVLRAHKYYNYLMIELYHTATTKEHAPKNPFTPILPMDCIWQFTEVGELKFLISVAQFQKRLEQKMSSSDLMALKTILKNALDCQFFMHKSTISENVSASSIVPIKLAILPTDLQLHVQRKQFYYEISGQLTLNNIDYDLRNLSLKFGCFVQAQNTFYLVDNLSILGLIEILNKNPENLLVHTSKFAEFKSEFLDRVESKIRIRYDYIPQATPAQIAEYGFENDIESMLYLSDLGEFVKIIPVLRYGDVEINIRTKRTIYGQDTDGKEFLVPRDKDMELRLLSLLIRQHPYFAEQLENELDYFYLHRKQFLNEEWFLKVFAVWREHQITILGFNTLSGNKLNPNPANISVKVVSGINWFNTQAKVRFGKRRASLKKIQLAVRNKTKYVQLDDGSLGILPEEWIEKFADYFNAGEIMDDETIRTPRINFFSVRQIYDPDMLEESTRIDLQKYRQKFTDFQSIDIVKPPNDFRGTLRPYQQEGLNWLNYLDQFNFGGCLADDMGLGKTIQVIAFILTQRKKVDLNVNLIVVPTSLIFNWKIEIDKFAPTLKTLIVQGADRKRSTKNFSQFEVILISYSTLLADINYLKKFTFNYAFLDESQNIKNPSTQRYRAAMLLKARNKIAITGTPIENNTFDLFSQFSFACPGLLGNQEYFRAIYSVPIDKFKNSQRAKELRQKIQPFLLRRTKQQVAQDLPEKTEMVLYCELKPEQRKIYEAYEKEFRDYISASDNEELRRTSMHVLRGLTKLRQICNSPRLIEQETPGEETSAKSDLLMEQLDDHAPQHKILIFSQFVGMLDLIKIELIKRNIPFVYLTGASKNRQQLVEQFQNDPAIRIFLISLKAGGTGLNLTAADYVYLVDPWWNPAVENQAIDRSHRIGQKHNVTAVRLISPDTLEEKIIKLQESKKVLTDDLIRADEGFFQSLSKDDLLGLLG